MACWATSISTSGSIRMLKPSWLVKPSHGLKILRGETGGGFSPKAAYIFRKQLEEADAIVINRIDEMPEAELAELAALVGREFPGVPVLRMSARTGQGFEALVGLLEQDGAFGRKILDIDYDVYAEGEAELGWLNASIDVVADEPFAIDRLLLEVVAALQAKLNTEGGEVAHLKAIGLGGATFGVANLVASKLSPELSLPAKAEVRELDLVVNARVAIDPTRLEALVREVVPAVCAAHGARATFRTMQSFRPGRPTPTHRYAVAGV